MTRIRLAAVLASAAAIAVVPAYAAPSAVNDRASIHNFRLRGPGVNVATSVGGTGFKSFTVTLKRGTYTFLCDPHAFSLKGSFRVR